MDNRDFSQLMDIAWKHGVKGLKEKGPTNEDKLVKQMASLEESNNTHLAEKKMPDYLRTPTADELSEMRQFAINLKNENKSMSKRQIRKATQAHFNIRIY
jgi:hypothetical protein